MKNLIILCITMIFALSLSLSCSSKRSASKAIQNPKASTKPKDTQDETPAPSGASAQESDQVTQAKAELDNAENKKDTDKDCISDYWEDKLRQSNIDADKNNPQKPQTRTNITEAICKNPNLSDELREIIIQDIFKNCPAK
ncbi:MAG: hypothetical protein ABIA04_15785 [Pseudomonadota bacterium]